MRSACRPLTRAPTQTETRDRWDSVSRVGACRIVPERITHGCAVFSARSRASSPPRA
jgi:hypothetical protein